jgi:hypothetical protein
MPSSGFWIVGLFYRIGIMISLNASVVVGDSRHPSFNDVTEVQLLLSMTCTTSPTY